MSENLTPSLAATFFGFTLTIFGLLNTFVFSKYNDEIRNQRTQLNLQIGKCKELVKTRGVTQQRTKLLNLNIKFLNQFKNSLGYTPSYLNYLVFASLIAFFFTFISLYYKMYFIPYFYPVFNILFTFAISLLVIFILFFLKIS